MENQAYIFLGFNLEKIKFCKNQIEELVEVRINVSSYGFDQDNKIFSLRICVELDYENSKDNTFDYLAGFKINDEEAIDDLDKDQDIDGYISVFLASVIPFIRSNLVAITIDTGTSVILPTIDCKSISRNQSLVLTINKS